MLRFFDRALKTPWFAAPLIERRAEKCNAVYVGGTLGVEGVVGVGVVAVGVAQGVTGVPLV